MPWMEWITQRHPLFTHLPVAVAVLLPMALIAAQRPGRGIRPWWTTCRYLTWAGVLGGLLAAAIGLVQARHMGLLSPEGYLAPKGSGPVEIFRYHQYFGIASLVMGLLCLRSVYRKRQDYQGIGFLSLFLGLLWSATTLLAVHRGDQLTWSRLAQSPKLQAQNAVAKEEKISAPVDLENKAPLRALDYLSLEPMHEEFMKSPAHGNRWIRVWVNAGAAEAYRNGQSLPDGSLVVMNTVENRWNRPSAEAGPLYALEMKGGRPSLTFYWPRVPEAQRSETNGESRVYWRGNAPELQTCQTCHANGIAPLKDRSRWTANFPVKVKTKVLPE